MTHQRGVPALLVAAVVLLAGCGGGSGSRAHRAKRAKSATTATTTTTLAPTSTTIATPPPTAGPARPRAGAVPSPQANCIAATPPEMARYLGLTLQGAETLAASQGLHVRVVGADGTCKMVTQEYDSRRVDVYLDRGLVTAAGTG